MPIRLSDSIDVPRPRFQDALGTAICKCVGRTPGGVLCFFPSYALMMKVRDRWRSTGLWRTLAAKKVVITEPRFSGKVFDQALNRYRRIVKEGVSCPRR